MRRYELMEFVWQTIARLLRTSRAMRRTSMFGGYVLLSAARRFIGMTSGKSTSVPITKLM